LEPSPTGGELHDASHEADLVLLGSRNNARHRWLAFVCLLCLGGKARGGQSAGRKVWGRGPGSADLQGRGL